LKQIIQNLKTGETILEEVPAPKVRAGQVLIHTTHSLVSLGTERMLVEFGKASLFEKARHQPEKVKMVLEKVKTDGLVPTVEAVFNKLEQPLPLGYCNVGRVVAVGEGVSGFSVGDRVVSNGPHAEFVCVPKNLVAAIPEGVTDEEAAFTVIGAIGLQGIRLFNPSFGETVVVTGLGLIGLLTAELLKANGCRVIGIDLDERKLELARAKGIITLRPGDGSDPVQEVLHLTDGIGADGVIITASAKTDEIVSQAARMSRKRGRIILVGVVGLQLNRSEFYEKELSFQVSCSYGPGRYDDEYEQKGHDYPLSYVRWTEQRNFQAVLQAMANGSLDVKPLITERVKLADYRKIYDNLSGSGSIASILEYEEKPLPASTVVHLSDHHFDGRSGVTGIIGAGNFTKMTLLPALKGSGIPLKYIASASGVTSAALGRKHGIACCTTDYHEILQDPEVDLVMITTRHHQHARMTAEALRAGKHVFVEKPLALHAAELDNVIDAYLSSPGVSLTVGFNRRFSPHAEKIRELAGKGGEPIHVVATMNAGFIPANSWVHDLETGGGRIIGEACHLIDLITFITGSRVKAVCMNALGHRPGEATDNATLLLRYEDGSNGVVNYFANGSKAYSKERLEVYSGGKTLVMDNFRVTQGYGFKGFSKLKTSLDKGHRHQFLRLMNSVKEGGAPLIPFEELINTTRASFAAIESLKQHKWIELL
jgi:predicted dehydrogenase/threonine dehydrogenase-like Zn-dependent dehydrogenase